jgi:hypothetical protein
VKNKGALESTLNNLTAKGNLQTRSEDYQKKTINYILLPFGSNLQPAYCFLNDYLLISTSNKPIQDCIDALSDKSKSLLVSKDFQAVNFGLMDKSNSLFFVKTDLFFDKVKKIGEWIIGWASLMSANIDAYQKQAQESLNLAEKQIQEEELKLQNIKVKQEALAAEIAEIKKQGSGQVSDKESELTSLAAQAKAKQDNIDSARKEFSAKQEDFKKATEYFAKRKADPSVVKLYLDEVAYPLLDGLKMIKAIGSVTNFKENVIEATTYYSQE